MTGVQTCALPIWLILKRLPFLGKEKLFSVKAHRIIGGVCALCICVLSVAGIQNADNIQVTEYELYVDKEAGDLDRKSVV